MLRWSRALCVLRRFGSLASGLCILGAGMRDLGALGEY